MEFEVETQRAQSPHLPLPSHFLQECYKKSVVVLIHGIGTQSGAW